MTLSRSRIAASLAVLASLSMTASPAFAHGYPDWHHRHHDGGSSGSLLAGLLIGGAVVAIASAASKSGNDAARDDRRDDPAEDQGYAEPAPMTGPDGAGDSAGLRKGVGFDDAADACRSEIEGDDRRIGAIDNIRRMGDRFSVEGHLEDGRGYACSVDEDGRIRSVSVDGRAMI